MMDVENSKFSACEAYILWYGHDLVLVRWRGTNLMV